MTEAKMLRGAIAVLMMRKKGDNVNLPIINSLARFTDAGGNIAYTYNDMTHVMIYLDDMYSYMKAEPVWCQWGYYFEEASHYLKEPFARVLNNYIDAVVGHKPEDNSLLTQTCVDYACEKRGRTRVQWDAYTIPMIPKLVPPPDATIALFDGEILLEMK